LRPYPKNMKKKLKKKESLRGESEKDHEKERLKTPKKS